MSSSSRFGEDTANEWALVAGAACKNTKKATVFWCNVFRDYCQSKRDVNIQLKTIEVSGMANLLETFQADVRTKIGDVYGSQVSLAARSAMQRELDTVGRKMNISKDSEFRQANRVLDGVLKKRIRPMASKKLWSRSSVD